MESGGNSCVLLQRKIIRKMEKRKTLAELIQMSKEMTKELEELKMYFTNEMKELERDIEALKN